MAVGVVAGIAVGIAAGMVAGIAAGTVVGMAAGRWAVGIEAARAVSFGWDRSGRTVRPARGRDTPHVRS